MVKCFSHGNVVVAVLGRRQSDFMDYFGGGGCFEIIQFSFVDYVTLVRHTMRARSAGVIRTFEFIESNL